MNCNQFPKWSYTPSTMVVDSSLKCDTAWRSFFSNNVENLVGYFTPDGYVLPSRDTAYIATLTGDKYIGRILFNCDTKKMMVNLTGTFVTVQTV